MIFSLWMYQDGKNYFAQRSLGIANKSYYIDHSKLNLLPSNTKLLGTSKGHILIEDPPSIILWIANLMVKISRLRAFVCISSADRSLSEKVMG